MSKVKNDPVNHPPHYLQGGLDCLDVLESMLTAEEFKGYCKGNAVKYIWREDHKGANIQDLKKAVFYLNRIIKKLENM